ncbi:hypothetical protein B0H11DRAFT_2015227 [Mycena galericulata]|nr:hypothetical protein B0H11DRAFT_2015227 [Mycena galericulata]
MTRRTLRALPFRAHPRSPRARPPPPSRPRSSLRVRFLLSRRRDRRGQRGGGGAAYAPACVLPRLRCPHGREGGCVLTRRVAREAAGVCGWRRWKWSSGASQEQEQEQGSVQELDAPHSPVSSTRRKIGMEMHTGGSSVVACAASAGLHSGHFG